MTESDDKNPEGFDENFTGFSELRKHDVDPRPSQRFPTGGGPTLFV